MYCNPETAAEPPSCISPDIILRTVSQSKLAIYQIRFEVLVCQYCSELTLSIDTVRSRDIRSRNICMSDSLIPFLYVEHHFSKSCCYSPPPSMVESQDWNPREPLGKIFPPMKNDLILRAARGVSSNTVSNFAGLTSSRRRNRACSSLGDAPGGSLPPWHVLSPYSLPFIP